MRDCSCYYLSRFDPDGNLVKLVTCHDCLTDGLLILKKTLDRPGDHWVQLVLRERGDSSESSETYDPGIEYACRVNDGQTEEEK